MQISEARNELVLNAELHEITSVMRDVAIAHYQTMLKQEKICPAFTEDLQWCLQMADFSGAKSPLMRGNPDAPEGVVIVTSDMGFMGALNARTAGAAMEYRKQRIETAEKNNVSLRAKRSNLVSEIASAPAGPRNDGGGLRRVRGTHPTAGITTRIIVIGRYGVDYCSAAGVEFVEFGGIPQARDEADVHALKLRDYLAGEMCAGRLGAVEVFYPRAPAFHVQEVARERIAPVAVERGDEDGKERLLRPLRGLAMTKMGQGLAMTKTEQGLAMTKTEQGLAMTKTEQGLAMTKTERGLAMTKMERGLAMTKMERGLAMAGREFIWESSFEESAEYLGRLMMARGLYSIFEQSKLAEFAARAAHMEDSIQDLKDARRGLERMYARLRHEAMDKSLREISTVNTLLKG